MFLLYTPFHHFHVLFLHFFSMTALMFRKLHSIGVLVLFYFYFCMMELEVFNKKGTEIYALLSI